MPGCAKRLHHNKIVALLVAGIRGEECIWEGVMCGVVWWCGVLEWGRVVDAWLWKWLSPKYPNAGLKTAF